MRAAGALLLVCALVYACACVTAREYRVLSTHAAGLDRIHPRAAAHGQPAYVVLACAGDSKDAKWAPLATALWVERVGLIPVVVFSGAPAHELVDATRATGAHVVVVTKEEGEGTLPVAWRVAAGMRLFRSAYVLTAPMRMLPVEFEGMGDLDQAARVLLGSSGEDAALDDMAIVGMRVDAWRQWLGVPRSPKKATSVREAVARLASTERPVELPSGAGTPRVAPGTFVRAAVWADAEAAAARHLHTTTLDALRDAHGTWESLGLSDDGEDAEEVEEKAEEEVEEEKDGAEDGEREEAAVLYLLTGDSTHGTTYVDFLIRSIISLRKHVFPHFREYPILVYHNNVRESELARITSELGGDIRFFPFTLEFPPSLAAEFTATTPTGSTCDGRAWPLPYLHMGRFFSHGMFRTQAFQQFDFLWRLDADIEFIKPPACDPIVMMREKGLVLAAAKNQQETAGCYTGLRKLTLDYAREHGLDTSDVEQMREGWALRGGMVVFRTSFFRQQQVLDYQDAVDASGGVYRYRWSEQVINPMVLGLFAEQGQYKGSIGSLHLLHKGKPLWTELRKRKEC